MAGADDYTDDEIRRLVEGGPTTPPAQVYYVPVRQQTNGLAVASFVLGLTWVFWIGSLLAVVFGLAALSQISASEGRQSGEGLAIAGLVLGLIGACTFFLWALTISTWWAGLNP
jgi:Domain of unknown function (DUF4190)